MKYHNPVVPGYFPDPSVTTDGEKFYLVNSTFQYFPGVTLFESDDLINWKQIGHVLTRESQLPLEHAYHSGGIFAPTIRYNEKTGRFYMITTNVTDGGNFLVYTDDIHGEWSEPIWLTQQGIDPSLVFADDTCYFIGNGVDEHGKNGVFVNEIDPDTGKNITEPVCVWHGTGGRFLEGPHLYKIGKYYYLMAAEGGTEYGHMEVYARGTSPYGPFESYAGNPFLTNRNLGGYELQGVGHADLVQDKNGNWWLIHLAFRQIALYMTYHMTGRETYLVPVTFDEDGWFSAGAHNEDRPEGMTLLEMETDRIPEDTKQEVDFHYTFGNTALGLEWSTMRKPLPENVLYDGDGEKVTLIGTDASILDPFGAPAFIGIRQRQYYGKTSVKISLKEGIAGLSVYMDESNHYDLMLRKTATGNELVKRYCIGPARCEDQVLPMGDLCEATVWVGIGKMDYTFGAVIGGKEVELGKANNYPISTEAAGGFVGILFALFAEPKSEAVFTEFDSVMTLNETK